MGIDEKWQKRQENGPFRVPVVALTPSLRYPEKSGTINRFTQSEYRKRAKTGFPVHGRAFVAGKCDFWTKLLTKATIPWELPTRIKRVFMEANVCTM